jgi:hypothetical protein
MASFKLAKWHVSKMTSWQNGMLAKLHVGKMACLQNGNLAKSKFAKW